MQRRIVLALLVAHALEGCVYTQSNLAHNKSGYTNYPTSIEAESARRKKRRRNALIAAPIEIIGGVALTALALYAPAEPSMADSPTGALKDAGKELLGRLLLAMLGSGIAISGVGDGVLGAIDPVFRSPLVRDGKLVPASQIDTIAPSGAPRFGIHASSVLSSDGVGGDFGFGFAHWLSPSVRLRHVATGDLTMGFETGRRLIVSGETLFEYAFGREHAGLYPRRSLGLYVAGGWAAIEQGEDLPVLRGGLALTMGRGFSYRLGTTFSKIERRPSIDFVVRSELRLD